MGNLKFISSTMVDTRFSWAALIPVSSTMVGTKCSRVLVLSFTMDGQIIVAPLLGKIKLLLLSF